jgi:hypothetical protein
MTKKYHTEAERRQARSAATMRWVKKNRARHNATARSQYYKHNRRVTKYGITANDFEWMVIQQGGRCVTCQRSDQKLCIDHDHTTGRVRGLLCNQCNLTLGHMEQHNPATIEALRQYLQDHQETK